MPAKTTSIALGDKLMEYTRKKVDSGEFGSVSEVVRDALRQAQKRDLRMERLRDLVREGEESGPAEPFDLEQFLTEMHKRHAKDAA